MVLILNYATYTLGSIIRFMNNFQFTLSLTLFYILCISVVVLLNFAFFKHIRAFIFSAYGIILNINSESNIITAIPD
jgi:hypothetical protein